VRYQTAIESREHSFVAHLRAWVESPDRKYVHYWIHIYYCLTQAYIFVRLPKAHRDHLQQAYNNHMLHSTTADPFKLALYKLMGKLEPNRRSVPLATATTEDWLWFQLAMVRPSFLVGGVGH
jgi:nuclear pore complex protein Nup93